LFGPLSAAYTRELTLLIHNSMGLVSMTKRLFWPVFWAAWTGSFTPKNVISAFKTTGIWPLVPDVILTKMKAVTPPPPGDTESTKTPTTARGLRRLHRKIKQEPADDDNLDKLLRASERLAAQQSILAHEVVGLKEAINMEKRKRYKGKRLNLVGDEAGGPILFSPGQVQRAREVIEQKEQDEIERRAGIEARKAAAALVRQQKAEEKAERAAALVLRRQAKAEEKARAAEDREAQKEAKGQSTALQVVIKTPKKVSTKRKRATTNEEVTGIQEVEEVTKTGLRGRSVKLPGRYKN